MSAVPIVVAGLVQLLSVNVILDIVQSLLVEDRFVKVGNFLALFPGLFCKVGIKAGVLTVGYPTEKGILSLNTACLLYCITFSVAQLHNIFTTTTACVFHNHINCIFSM